MFKWMYQNRDLKVGMMKKEKKLPDTSCTIWLNLNE